MLKTGIIQPESVPGAFTANLRNIVTLYRDCVDKGAQIVLCPAMALSGINTGDLHYRAGFIDQLKAALNYLAKEIMHVPLLMAERYITCYSEHKLQIHILYGGRLYSQEDHLWIDAENPVFPLVKTEFAPGFELSIFQDSADLLIAMQSTSWPHHKPQDDKKNVKLHRAEWQLNVPTAILHPAGAQGEHILPGGSCLITPDDAIARLKLFEQDAAVITAADCVKKEKLPSALTLLRQALCKGTADFITRRGYQTAYVNLLETPYVPILLNLLKNTLPSLRIIGVIPLDDGLKEAAENAVRLAKKLHIEVSQLPVPSMPDALLHTSWLIRHMADEDDACYLSALCATDAFTEPARIRAAIAADFLPLGDLFMHDLKQLFPKEITLTAEQKESSRRLETLCRKENSAGVLLRDIPEHEAEIRRYQRLIEKTAPQRRKLPPRLRLSPRDRQRIPLIHGLRD